MTRSSAGLSAFVLLAVATAACGASAAHDPHPRHPSPAAPAGAARPAGDAPERETRAETDADVEFMYGMIAHHEQALEMTALVPERTSNRTLDLLAERIEVSQRDEIARMKSWLRDRGHEAPGGDVHHREHHRAGGGDPQAPGMLTAGEMDRLAASSGDEFDRRFLDSMIQHHEGALVMVAELFATPGAGQEPEIFQFASEVDSDQRMEIERMQRVRESLDS